MKDLSYYLRQPYTVVMRRDSDGDLVARIEELPGCAAHGATATEALSSLEDAQRAWIEDCLEAGDSVPEPALEEPLPSGKWLQRVPRTLHRKLIAMAKRENTSLNQLVTSLLAEALGTRSSLELSFARRYQHLSDWSLASTFLVDAHDPSYWLISQPEPKVKPLPVHTAIRLLATRSPSEEEAHPWGSIGHDR